LELIGFDVTDENQDGIFEPGEHILIQHVRIRNTGRPQPTHRSKSTRTQILILPRWNAITNLSHTTHCYWFRVDQTIRGRGR
jgi:hypothetical protein